MVHGEDLGVKEINGNSYVVGIRFGSYYLGCLVLSIPISLGLCGCEVT